MHIVITIKIQKKNVKHRIHATQISSKYANLKCNDRIGDNIFTDVTKNYQTNHHKRSHLYI